MEESNEEAVLMEDKMNQFMQAQTGFREQLSEAVANKTRFNLDLDAVRSFDPKLAQFVMKKPTLGIKLFEKRLTQMMAEIRDESAAKVAPDSKVFPVRVDAAKVTIGGNLGRNFVTPRGLKAHLLNQVVRVQGIVTRSTTVKPKLQKSYHYIEETKQGHV